MNVFLAFVSANFFGHEFHHEFMHELNKGFNQGFPSSTIWFLGKGQAVDGCHRFAFQILDSFGFFSEKPLKKTRT